MFKLRNRRETDTRKTETEIQNGEGSTDGKEWGFQSPTDEHCWDVLRGYDRKVKNDLNSLLRRSKTKYVLSSIQRNIPLHAMRIMNIALSH